MRTTATTQELNEALDIVNNKYNDNIDFNRNPERASYNNYLNFTLKVKDSKKEGARTGHTGRRLINACWHVHGDFFDALFSIREDIIIFSRKKKITEDSGNWEDRNIGSQMQPLYFSEACNC